MFQIIFNKISAAEISQLPTLEQLALLDEFKVTPEDLDNPDGHRFGKVVRDGRTIYRYRAEDHRIYFSIEGENLRVHRVVRKNTFTDFGVRSNLGPEEDEQLAESPHFWRHIQEGEEAEDA